MRGGQDLDPSREVNMDSGQDRIKKQFLLYMNSFCSLSF